MLRFATFHRVEGDKIVETALFIDLLHLMMQAGQYPLPPQTGAHLVQPGPGSSSTCFTTSTSKASMSSDASTTPDPRFFWTKILRGRPQAGNASGP